MDSFSLYCLIDEVKNIIVGKRINKIYQKNEDFLFKLSNKDNLLISLSTPSFIIINDKFDNPSTPPAFCMLLRKYLSSSFITDIISKKFYRECIIKLEKKSNSFELVINLSLKSRNIILKKGNDIIANFNNYKLPEESNIAKIDLEQFKVALKSKVFTGFPPFFIKEFIFLSEKYDIETSYKFYINLYEHKINFIPVLIENKPYPVLLQHLKNSSNNIVFFSNFNELFLKIYREKTDNILEQEYINKTSKETKKIKKSIKNIEKEILEKKDFEQVFKYGELLKANIYKIKKGDNSIKVTDYFDEQMREITIPLQKDKSPQENIELYFKKAKKFKRGYYKLLKRREELLEKLHLLETNQFLFIQSQKQEAKEKQENSLYQEVFFQNKKIFIGKSNKGNDFIIKKFGKPDYLWLHIKDYSGAHVIIAEKEEKISEELLQFAAKKAFENSKAKNNSKGEVIYTPLKYVKKIKGAPLGQVSVLRFDTITIKN